MVVMFLLRANEMGIEQLRIGWPSMCTVHAPQRPLPQPNLVPRRFKWSRSTHKIGVLGATLIEWGWPFNLNFACVLEFAIVESDAALFRNTIEFVASSCGLFGYSSHKQNRCYNFINVLESSEELCLRGSYKAFVRW